MTNDNNNIKLANFWIEKRVNSTYQNEKTAAKQSFYLAPEVLEGKKYDGQAESWSLGCIIYELITLNKPLWGDDVTALTHNIKNKIFEPLPLETDFHLRLLVEKLLNRDPAIRISIKELSADPTIHKYINYYQEQSQKSIYLAPAQKRLDL